MLTPNQLIERFLPLSNWQDRYRQIILLAKQLPDLDEKYKTEESQILGCENRVWLTYSVDDKGVFIFYGDSEGRIVKGLLAILLILANGKTAEEIEKTDFLAELAQLKIIDELSESRQLGLSNIIAKIKLYAQQASAKC